MKGYQDRYICEAHSVCQKNQEIEHAAHMNEHLRRYSERALCVKWNINQSSEKVDIQYVLSFFVIMNMISQGIQNLHIYCPNIYCCNLKYLAISALISFTWIYSKIRP